MVYVLSGDAALNFQVVGGTTQLTTPSENTIWVNTDTSITTYVFSPTQPSNPVEGLVWIEVGASSNSEFNALKKDNITICPVNCHQYVSGAWVKKTVQSYQNGAWENWYTYLYNLGDERTELTGGWELSASRDSFNSYIYKTETAITGVFKNIYNSGGAWQHIQTATTLDVTDYKTLMVNDDWISAPSAGGLTIYLKILDSSGSTVVQATGTNTLDISQATGDCYVYLGAYGSNWETSSVKVNITQIWLER